MAFSSYFHAFSSFVLQFPAWIHVSVWMPREALTATCNTMAITVIIMVLLLGWNLRNPRARAENTWFLLVCWFYWPWLGNRVLGRMGDYSFSLNFGQNPIIAQEHLGMDEQHQASIFVNSLSVVKSNPLVIDLSWNNIGIEICCCGNTKVKGIAINI